LSKTINESEIEIDISALPPGIYLLKLRNGRHVISTSKLIIIRTH